MTVSDRVMTWEMGGSDYEIPKTTIPERNLWFIVLCTGIANALNEDRYDLRWIRSHDRKYPGSFGWIIDSLGIEYESEIRAAVGRKDRERILKIFARLKRNPGRRGIL